MKPFKKNSYTLITLMALLVLFQSCTVYKKQPVTLEEAAKAREKTKILMADGSVKKFKYITNREQAYYGVKPSEPASKTMMEELLPPKAVSVVKIKDQKASNRLSIIVAGLPAVGLLAFGFWYFSTGDWID